MKQRLYYFLIFAALFALETLIALSLHGGFIRSYMGDVIVVWVVYCFVQMLLGGRNNHYIVALGVLVFAFAVEFMQAINIVELLGVQNNAFLRTVIGTSFSWGDLVCYTVGTAVEGLGIWTAANYLSKK
ncbi:MAG: DUF2809 domain-containing protein [Firmicutes bacterium]|nr:DUF2809 domain-containing protein [Bacillota bacterium]MBQ9604993.1 DUF2809 domain-containing protein [Bacillota bacterium]